MVYLWRFGWDTPQAVLWAVLLLVQAFPYGAALMTSLAGSMPRLHLVLPQLGTSAWRWWWQLGERRTPLG